MICWVAALWCDVACVLQWLGVTGAAVWQHCDRFESEGRRFVVVAYSNAGGLVCLHADCPRRCNEYFAHSGALGWECALHYEFCRGVLFVASVPIAEQQRRCAECAACVLCCWPFVGVGSVCVG